MYRRPMCSEECEERLAAGWFVGLDDCCDYDSAQRKRYIRLEREQLNLSHRLLGLKPGTCSTYADIGRQNVKHDF